MFNDVDADVYVLVDGDNTCETAAAPHLVEKLINSICRYEFYDFPDNSVIRHFSRHS
jgi:hypothetical protein